MSDVVPSAPLPPRRISLTVGLAIACAVAVLSILLTVWAMNRFHGDTTTTTQPAAAPTAAAPATKVIVTPPVATDPATLSAREELLGAQLTALEQRTSAVTGAAATAYGNATRAEALMVAFAARRAIDRGLGLGYLEQQLRDRFGTSQPSEVAAIVDAGRNPLTIEDLRAGIDRIGPQLALGPTDSGGWGGAVWRMLTSLIVIHPKDTPSPVPGERLNRVKRLLDAGQVEAAVEELARMPGASQASSWLTGARRYVTARRALDTLDAAAIGGRAANPAPAIR
ncbi:MAG: hypothetical protein J0I47_12820 [Sphingomonas sp.]|uniref:hypothetical protein n=1 Tax=Sphingomonas sp. TaxID=28214 RepID=UPI001ACAC481|nr:hypothetical protein [Sphingomonas sp.]MBN8809099.1 hypothetical protein [Sphingomonas sp.]